MNAATSSHTRGIVAGSFLPREQPRANSLASSERASLMSSSKFAYKQKLNISNENDCHFMKGCTQLSNRL